MAIVLGKSVLATCLAAGVDECHVSMQFLLEIKDGSLYNFTFVILNKNC